MNLMNQLTKINYNWNFEIRKTEEKRCDKAFCLGYLDARRDYKYLNPYNRTELSFEIPSGIHKGLIYPNSYRSYNKGFEFGMKSKNYENFS